MSKAHDALHIVFNLHAGFLQSYEVDERKRMLKCYHIVCDTEGDIYWVWQTGDDAWDWVLDILQRLRNN